MYSNMMRFLVIMEMLIATGAASRADEPIRIMPVGDSIAVGYTNLPGQPEVPFEYGWRAGLYTQLTSAGHSFQYVGSSGQPVPGPGYTGPDLEGLDQNHLYGGGGGGTSWVSENIRGWVRDSNPDVILLMIGINDIPQYSTGHPNQAECNLNAIVQKTIAAKPSAHLIVAQTIPYAHYTDAVVQYNSYIRDTLVPYYYGMGFQVSTVDQYFNFLAAGEIDPSLYSNAINHPSPTGYERMAQTWFDGIEALGAISHTALPEIHTLADENLLSGKPVVASSVYNGSFDPSYATDGSVNQQVFRGTADGGTDADMRLVIHDIGGGFNQVRIWRDMDDPNREPAQVILRSSVFDTTSLDAGDFERVLAVVSHLDFGMEEYIDILVDAPEGTQSLFLDFGGFDSNGIPYGIRVPEVQAFLLPEPSAMAVLIGGLVLYGFRRRNPK